MEFGSTIALVLACSVLASNAASKPGAPEAEPQPCAATPAAASSKQDQR